MCISVAAPAQSQNHTNKKDIFNIYVVVNSPCSLDEVECVLLERCSCALPLSSRCAASFVERISRRRQRILCIQHICTTNQSTCIFGLVKKSHT